MEDKKLSAILCIALMCALFIPAMMVLAPFFSSLSAFIQLIFIGISLKIVTGTIEVLVELVKSYFEKFNNNEKL